MEPFEDENPFSTADPPLSSASSNSHVDVSAPSSPPNRAVTLPSSPPRITIQTSSLRTGFPSQGSGHSPRPPTSKSDFCCIRDHWLHSGEDVEILVSASYSSTYFCIVSLTSCLARPHADHGRTEDERKFNFAVHNLCHPFGCESSAEHLKQLLTFCSQNAEARHRYSEFESLRLNLTKLYPTLIVPPIPSKQTIGDYAIKQAKAREDAALIARRKRMLQTFLNRIARHPIISNEHVFHRFLQGEVSWVCTHILKRYAGQLSSCPHRRRLCIRHLSHSFRKTFSRPLRITQPTPMLRPLTRHCRTRPQHTPCVVRINVS